MRMLARRTAKLVCPGQGLKASGILARSLHSTSSKIRLRPQHVSVSSQYAPSNSRSYSSPIDTPSDSDRDISLDYTLPFQLTKTIHRDVYEEISPTNSNNSAKGKIVLITGGGTGLGAAAAKVWLRAGAKGIIIASHQAEDVKRSSDELEELRDELGAETKLLAATVDLIQESHAEDLFARIKETFERPPDVVMANAGYCPKPKPLHQGEVDDWWRGFEVNVKVTHNTVRSFIRSQDKPESPVGTIICTSSGLTGMHPPGLSAYCSSKLAVHRYMEFVHAEYPSLCTFTLLAGIVPTQMMIGPEIKPYAKDKAEMVGSVALYLSTKRADYLRGSLMSVNWDINEMEEHKVAIKEKGLLRIKWIPALPCSGGTGLEDAVKNAP